MGKITVKALVEGGKASAAPPLGPNLATAKINIGEVISAINERTKDFSGIQVPVEVIVDTETKEFKIKVGTPPVSEMIKKELKLEKLAKTAWKEPSPGNLTIEQVVKITKAKFDSLGTHNFKNAIKQVVASCVSSGISIDSKPPKEVIKEINEGNYDQLIRG